MTSIVTTFRTHRRALAVVGALAVLVLAVVAPLLYKAGQGHDMHHLLTHYHHLPQFVQAFLGAGHLGSGAG